MSERKVISESINKSDELHDSYAEKVRSGEEISEEWCILITLSYTNNVGVEKYHQYKTFTSINSRGPSNVIRLSLSDAERKVTNSYEDSEKYGRIFNLLERGGYYTGNDNFQKIQRGTVLLETVEGRELLEAVLLSFDLEWIPLDLPEVRYTLDEFTETVNVSEVEDKWKDTTETPPEESCTRDELHRQFFNKVDGTTKRYVYVLELRNNETSDVAYYVGDSKQPLQRLATHAKCGGDFKHSSEYEITGLDSLSTTEDESEVYERVDRDTGNGTSVFGGH